MCSLIVVVDDQSQTAIWDPDEVTISVQGGTHPHELITELADLLADLGAPITATGGGLACFCGEPITIPHDATAVAPL